MLLDTFLDLLSAWKLPLLLLGLVLSLTYHLLLPSPLNRIPGPKLYALTKWRLALDDLRGVRTRRIKHLHDTYGPVVRIAPNEISFHSLDALHAIYGAGSGFERTPFYAMFDVYGRRNLFSFPGVRDHAARKRLLNHAYSKSVVLAPPVADVVEAKCARFLEMVDREAIPVIAHHPHSGQPQQQQVVECEVFTALHHFSLDAITAFLYGPQAHGGTDALGGDAASRALLDDILHPSRRRLTWFAVHLPRVTAWLYSRPPWLERILTALHTLPMRRPTTYSGIRAHALRAWQAYEAAPAVEKETADTTVMARLANAMNTAGLSGLDVASECADHLLAGIDTTADTLMFALYALALPEHADIQRTLHEEIAAHISPSTQNNAGGGDGGSPLPVPLRTAASLPYLDAVLRETLRLYAPLPASEPRLSPTPTTIAGHAIPAGTTVSMAPYTLHRDPAAFPDPLVFDPSRWLGGPRDRGAESRRWWWAFSSGARMCIGQHLAMAEMVGLLSAVMARWEVRLGRRMCVGEGAVSPGVTSRFEVFADEGREVVREHECWIELRKKGV